MHHDDVARGGVAHFLKNGGLKTSTSELSLSKMTFQSIRLVLALDLRSSIEAQYLPPLSLLILCDSLSRLPTVAPARGRLRLKTGLSVTPVSNLVANFPRHWCYVLGLSGFKATHSISSSFGPQYSPTAHGPLFTPLPSNAASCATE